MNLFYAAPENVRDGQVIISGQEAEHIAKVLRHSIGDTVKVTDGEGNCYESKIRDFRNKTVFLEISDSWREPAKKTAVCLCLGIIKKRDRLEFAVEKAVELGVSKIVLFKGEHSQKDKVREDRLEKTVIAAMKQSLRFYLPTIVVEDSLPAAISNHTENSKVIVADETKEGGTERNELAKKYFLIVGPEGGFSERERKYLQSIEPGYYSLGEKRLRTETAAIVMADRFANQK